MKYSRFEELPVWKAAIELAVHVFALTAKPNFKGRFSLRIRLNGPLFQFRTILLKASSGVPLKSFSLSCIFPVAHAEKCGRCFACSSICPASMI